AHCTEPMGCLATLQEPIDFDAPDDIPVDILFVLLVPETAHQEHLNILAQLAGLFSQPAFSEQLRAAEDAQALYTLATTWPV
ncbi:MAG TPA: PTS sugar transporter subunit IIA, partial [Kineobactrum sp.]